MSEPLLRISDLVIEAEASHGEWRRIVDGVSLELARGEVLGLIGESGAGKSTIGLAALGYTRPHCRFGGGRVVLAGQDLLGLPPHALLEVRGRASPTSPRVRPPPSTRPTTIDQQVAEIVLRHRLAGPAEARRQAAGLYRELALPDPRPLRLERYPHQVSGGQLQRAMVAMAMAGRPDLIVFDEPTTALDVTTQIEVLAAIRKGIRDHGTAALYITHDLAVVAQVADRILVLRHGRMVETGATTQILNAPREPYTQALVAARSEQPKPIEPEEPPLLQARGVAAAYGGGALRVLEGINLDVPRGRTVAVVGESGSGKSTLARVITGLLPPIEGRISFAGEPLPPRLDGRQREQLRRLQLIYQMPDVALNPRQRVRRDHRPPARAVPRAEGQAPAAAHRGAARTRSAWPRSSPAACRASSRAARSSASASPGRSPPSPTSSSATRSPPPSTRWSPRRSWTCSSSSSARPASPTSSSPTTSAW